MYPIPRTTVHYGDGPATYKKDGKEFLVQYEDKDAFRVEPGTHLDMSFLGDIASRAELQAINSPIRTITHDSELSFAELYDRLRPPGTFVSPGTRLTLRVGDSKASAVFAGALSPKFNGGQKVILLERPETPALVAALKAIGARSAERNWFRKSRLYSLDIGNVMVKVAAPSSAPSGPTSAG
jgi:hypothetical protein